MKAVMKAKILSHEVRNSKNIHTVVEPAADAYSQPSTFRVSSLTKLGEINQEVNLSVVVSGFIKSKPYRDKNTGESKVFEEQVSYYNAELYQKV